MGVVACKDEIYDSVMDASPMGSVELFHGYTYSGIPVAVAAALAVQDIFEKEDIFNRAKNLAPYFQKGLFSLQDLESVENIRGYGMMGGIDIGQWLSTSVFHCSSNLTVNKSYCC